MTHPRRFDWLFAHHAVISIWVCNFQSNDPVINKDNDEELILKDDVTLFSAGVRKSNVNKLICLRYVAIFKGVIVIVHVCDLSDSACGFIFMSDCILSNKHIVFRSWNWNIIFQDGKLFEI